MGLEARVRKLRDEALAQGHSLVSARLQGVTKARVSEILRSLDLDTPDRVDAVFALLDDTCDSWFPKAPSAAKFCDGATIAHIACHVGILQRGSVKLDREGRDYWIKPLRDVGIVEPVFLDSKTRQFLPGHPVTKSPNSAHRIAASFKRILQAPAPQWPVLLAEWIKEDNVRKRLAFQAAQADEARRHVDSSHADLIEACVKHCAPRFLQGFEVVFIDDSDGERITDEDRENLQHAGLELRLDDSIPDVLLHNVSVTARPPVIARWERHDRGHGEPRGNSSLAGASG